MKKLIAVAAMAFTAVAFAGDSYLYWMMPTTVTWKETTDTPTGYSYAAIGVMDGEGHNVTYLNNYAFGGTSEGGDFVAKADATSGWYANLSTYATSGYSFYIELFNDSVSIGRSTDILSYSDALAYATTFGTDVPKTTAWAPTSFTTAAIPEPTSGLLMLVGLAGLALRRKRQQMA